MPGGTRSGTNAASSGNRNTSGNDYYNSYGNTSPQPSSDRATESYWNDDDEMAARYALDSSDMRNDDYAPKYGSGYHYENDDATESIASPSKFDAAKIVVAILVIFFILFHTVKTMAIAEEKDR